MTKTTTNTTTSALSSQLLPPLNLSALDGIRCFACLSIIVLHMHYVYGSLFFPSDEPCMQSIANLPLFLGPLFFNLSFQMSLFWILSGFLCEYQLDRLVITNNNNNNNNNSRLTASDYGRFLLNRWMRLYPLFAFFNVVSFLTKGTECSKDPQKFVASMFFVLRNSPNQPATVCAGSGWSVMVDVHGYLVLVGLHAMLMRMSSTNKVSDWKRKVILPGLYVMALMNMVYAQWRLVNEKDLVTWKDVHRMSRGGWLSLEYILDMERRQLVLVPSGVDPHALWTFRGYQFDTEYLNQMRSLRDAFSSNTYFVSVHKNGSAMFLGSLLYLNMKCRLQKPRQPQDDRHPYYMAMIKLGAAISIFWATSFSYIFSGVPCYLFVDANLTLSSSTLSSSSSQQQTKQQQPRLDTTIQPSIFTTVWNRISPFLSFSNNPLWTSMAPFTYGIYMTHMVVLVIYSVPINQNRAARMNDPNDEAYDPCQDYNLTFMAERCLKTLFISWGVALFFYYTVEWPFRYLRKRYLSSTTAERESWTVKKTN